MNNSILSILFLLPIIAMFNLILNQTHFLMVLLSLEGVLLTLILLVPTTLMTAYANNPTSMVVMLTLGVCEASLGLSLMVLMSRSCGNDMLNSMTMNKC